ncbi:MAG: hypothetical protein K6T75_11025, partial [Acetobacteraceae bacterium]|nr:hypothetical protein [Acetobacteraceae bacterium]
MTDPQRDGGSPARDAEGTPADAGPGMDSTDAPGREGTGAAAGPCDAASELLDLARAWGADLAGQARMGRVLALSLGVGLSRVVIDGVRRAKRPTLAYAQHYQAVNALLDQIALRLSRAAEARGLDAQPVPASQYQDRERLLGAFPHKTAAVCAGLGWIGRSGLLLVPGLGPRVRLATVLVILPRRAGAGG